MSYAKIKDEFNYVKDQNSGAVININQKGLSEYKTIRNNILKNSETANKVSQLEQELLYLKQLLNDLRGLK